MTAFDPRLKMGRQMEETLRLRTGVFGKEAVERAENASGGLGLSQPRRVLDSYPAQLSGGMLQRAAAALLMALHPKYILADEPTSALDAEIERFCWSFWRSSGKPPASCLSPRCCRTPRPLRDGLCDGAWNADRTGDDSGTSGTPQTGVDQGICAANHPVSREGWTWTD